ncbi:SDR family NAD(P)-dependent oxidoreductase [Chitinophaga pinensis]|uniref:Short-chain dehydrogenase/reductase SDR n=1 Tax=Chitinophaga pinensis (strain ATCC 43595 / DSM 2588 / LMG 13176 / NBRC 15968 / NCIMB 11800 / UQM 2034) TaxID=485918 RepID=A0A979G4F5_CHIPD|nr:SDR family NAD(P)-dependent oxidoreductase [Chitinophaga pinensis]ACU60609.1 short-chain dehydrogenase/reductase SDR [Chitinophaga pinensis DSM 2588]
MAKTVSKSTSDKKNYIITGPTSGIGYATALELAKHGNVILMGRNPDKLNQVKEEIVKAGHQAVTVVCDMSDLKSIQQAVAKIIQLNVPIAGLLNNAGVMLTKPGKNAQGWDLTYATNYLGAFALTEALAPYLSDGANVAFISSAIEDPERKPAKAMGMKGARFISVAASANGEWLADGSKLGGIDAYATSKQCVLAAALYFARENPRLHFNAIEPGITRGTRLGGANPVVQFIFGHLMAIIPPFSHYASTPRKSAKVITRVLTDDSNTSGVYFDEKAQPMRGSILAHDPVFQEKVVHETRAFLAKFF